MIPAHESFDGTWPFEGNGFRQRYVDEGHWRVLHRRRLPNHQPTEPPPGAPSFLSNSPKKASRAGS
jgi:hypothetical protein